MRRFGNGAALLRPRRTFSIVFGCVLQLEEAAAVLELQQVGDRDERLDRAVAGTRSLAGEGGVDPTDVRGILMECGRRRLVGGQEDIIFDIALNFAAASA
jgi:hypothetical protein